MQTQAPVREVSNLRKTYHLGKAHWFASKREVHAVNDVSFTVHAGETLGIVGESGSGKSTIGKCLLRLIQVEGGQILFNGRDLTRLSEHQLRPLRKDIQMIFQDPFATLKPHHHVERNISYEIGKTSVRDRGRQYR